MVPNFSSHYMRTAPILPFGFAFCIVLPTGRVIPLGIVGATVSLAGLEDGARRVTSDLCQMPSDRFNTPRQTAHHLRLPQHPRHNPRDVLYLVSDGQGNMWPHGGQAVICTSHQALQCVLHDDDVTGSLEYAGVATLFTNKLPCLLLQAVHAFLLM